MGVAEEGEVAEVEGGEVEADVVGGGEAAEGEEEEEERESKKLSWVHG